MRPQQPVPRPAPRPVADNAPPATPPPPAVYDPSVPVDQRLVSQWPVILKSLSRVARRRFDVAALLRSSSSRAIVDNTLVVRFSHQSNSERLQDELGDPRVKMEVERVLEQVLGEPITISVDADGSRQQAATNGESSGHLLRAAMNLGGQLVTNSAGVPVENASVPTPVARWRRPAHQRPRRPWRRPAHQRPCRPWRRPAYQRPPPPVAEASAPAPLPPLPPVPPVAEASVPAPLPPLPPVAEDAPPDPPVLREEPPAEELSGSALDPPYVSP